MKSGTLIFRLLGCLLLVQAVAGPPVAAAVAPGVTLAVADFADESIDGWLIGVPQLTAEFVGAVSAGEAGALQVVPVEGVRAAIQGHGFTQMDLVHPSRAAAIARSVGAQWIVTGRWTHLDLHTRDDPLAVPPILRPAIATARVEIRVLDAASRRTLLQEAFAGSAVGRGDGFLLRHAARAAVRRAAARIVALQPQAIARMP